MRRDLLNRTETSGDFAADAPASERAPNGHEFPQLRQLARAGLTAADSFCTALTPGAVREAPSLITIALHSLCATRAQLNDPALAPNQNVCMDDFRALLEVMLESGYAGVSPEQVAAGLAPAGKFFMITFDDGYYNNVMVLDLLDEYAVPATFFVSSSHVLEQKAFWWDALNRQLMNQGASRRIRDAELRRLKNLNPAQIEEYLHRRFGPAALRPHSDVDRPFTRAELMDFSRHRRVHVGNHTADHAILTRCSRAEMARQIRSCQEALTDISGRAPIAIAYPNGNHSPAVVDAALAAGLRIGLTVRPAKDQLPLAGAHRLMRLGRFYFQGGADPRREFQKWRCGFIPSRLLRSMLQ